MHNMTRYLIVGKNGKVKPDDIFDISYVNAEYFKKNYAPLIEMDSNYFIHNSETTSVFIDPNDEIKFLHDLSERIFKEWGKTGHWKDCLQITKHEIKEFDITQKIVVYNIYTVDFVGRFGYDKPGMAADLIPFVCDGRGRLYFIGIYRKFLPGVGKPATIGGFRNINGYHFATGTETVVSEGKEETGLKIKVYEPARAWKKDPMADGLNVKVTLGKNNPIEARAFLWFLGMFRTANTEKNRKLKKKRVYETNGYTVLAYVKKHLEKSDLENLLEAGDDAAKLMVCEVGKDPFPDFYSKHHATILREALKKYDLKWD